MNTRPSDARWAGVSVATPAMRARRRFARLRNGVVRLDQRIRCSDTCTGIDATGPYWVFAIVGVARGRVAYVHGRTAVQPPGRRFAVYLPPYAIAESRLDAVRSSSIALAGQGPVPADLDRAVAFETSRAELPVSLEEVAALVRGAAAPVPIGRARDPQPLAARLKRMIDAGYCDLPPLTRLAARLRTSPSVLSRVFRDAYGMPPVKYRHAIRVMDAMMRLIGGEPPADVAMRVGFNDLGQFYRRFGSLALAPPAKYRSRNPKPR